MIRHKVIIHTRLSGAPGRNQLNGILRHLGRTEDWDLRFMQNEAELIEELQATVAGVNSPDGFIIASPVSDQCCNLIAKIQTPTVLIDIRSYRIPNREKNLAFVQNDDDGIGQTAAKYLFGLGNFRSYAFVHFRQSSPWSTRRETAFASYLQQHGHKCAVYAPNDFTSAEDRQHLIKFLNRLKRPAAVFAAWDNRALEVLECARAAKINLPEEMALLGVDDDLLCEHTSPPLSSVRPDNELEGYRAAELLDKMFRKRKYPKLTLCKVSGISERESSSAVAPGAHLIRRALQFIEQNKTNLIKVTDVVKFLGVSRRLADLRFKQFQHESILETITRIRLKEVQRRLRQSQLSIAKIATTCGFPDPAYLMVLFHRKFGMTMRDWREQNQNSA